MFRQKVSDIKRFNEILEILLKNEAGYLIEKLGLMEHLPFHKRVKAKTHDEIGPERLRKTFEDLGPTFIKLGQMFANRPDVTPQRYVEELEKLEYAVDPVEWEEIKPVIEDEVGLDSFEYVDEEPLAAASIAQVHEARLKSGEEVVLKVRRPEIVDQVETDLEILDYMVGKAEKHSSKVRDLRAQEIVEQFCSWTRDELDFGKELRNAETFKQTLPEKADARAPKFYKEYCTEAVLTMGKIDGVRCTNTEKLRDMDVSIDHIKDTLIHVGLKQTISHGFFHGDPHPSNFLIEEKGTVVYIDFGIMGVASEKNRESLGLLLIHLVNEDVKSATDIIEEISTVRGKADREQLERLISEKTVRLKNMSLKDGSVTRELVDLAIKATDLGYSLPNSIVLIGKDLMTIEGIAMKISPETRINDDMKKYALEALKESNKPEDLAETAAIDMIQNKDLFTKFASKINQKLETDKDIVVKNELKPRNKTLDPIIIFSLVGLGLAGSYITEGLIPIIGVLIVIAVYLIEQ